MMEIPFIKLQGNGNDFILIDEKEAQVIPDEMKGTFARLYLDRRFGIGGDGVLFLSASETADVKMRLFQPDESEAEMCGNGIRCLARFAFDAGYVKEQCKVETLAGEIGVEMGFAEELFSATIRMPDPAFDRGSISATGEAGLDYEEEIAGYNVYAANTGVPHAVVFVDEIGQVPIMSEGPVIRNHASFPRGANVNFVEVKCEDELHIRTFERGVEAETFSCGTGATAAAAVAHRHGKVGEKVLVVTKGGPLTVFLGEETKVQGPAEPVFSGVIPF
jgi:diaminopimelate epimerase